LASAKTRAALRGCRVVTTSMTERLLLRRQLQSLEVIAWCVLSGDAFENPPPGLRVEVIPVRRELSPTDVPAAVRMWRFFKKEDFAFVQTHTQKASLLGLPAARLSGTRALYTVHGALYFRGNARLSNFMGWFFEKWCCTWAHQVLVQSEEDEKTLPESHLCPARKIRYVGNGISMDRFLEAVPPEFESDLPVALMVSRLVREKGCRDFIELARALAGKAVFVHVGPPEHDQRDALTEDELSAAAEWVSFVGPVDDVRPYLAAADVVVQPSYREGIPRVAMEAAASGKPVVAYDIRGMREVIDPSSGLLVRRGDTRRLEATVEGLLADPGRRHELGESCRARVTERFAESDVVERLRGVYADAPWETRRKERSGVTLGP